MIQLQVYLKPKHRLSTTPSCKGTFKYKDLDLDGEMRLKKIK